MNRTQYHEVVCTAAFADVIESLPDSLWDVNFGEDLVPAEIAQSIMENTPSELLREIGIDPNNDYQVHELAALICEEGF